MKNTAGNPQRFSHPLREGVVKNLILLAMLLLLALAIACAVWFQVGKNPYRITNTAISIAVLGFQVCLILCIQFGSYQDPAQFHLFCGLIYAAFLSTFSSSFVYMTSDGAHTLLPAAMNTASLVFASVYWAFFWLYMESSIPATRREKKITKIVLCFIGLYAAHRLAIFAASLVLGVSSYGSLSERFGLIQESMGLVFLALYLLHILHLKLGKKDKLLLVSYVLTPNCCILIRFLWMAAGNEWIITALVDVCGTLSLYVIFFALFLERNHAVLLKEMEFARKDQQLARQEREQTELKTALMLSQIQPHFLYNALTAIRVLCRTDPRRAEEAITHFSSYLRTNMDSLQGGRLIPFQKELEHTKTYLMIEQMRFGDDLRVCYDIPYSSFSLPALTLQPLVENAVRHGVCQKEEGGTVTIRTRQVGDAVHLSVSDDGPGFDPGVRPNDGRLHVGLDNVRSRLETLADGELFIDSRPGQGTTVTVILREEPL